MKRLIPVFVLLWSTHVDAQVNEDLDSERLSVQQRIVAIVPAEQATATAVSDGRWSDPATWDSGVPGPSAQVLIPIGRSVNYDVVSNDAIAWVRVDGALTFATDSATRMTVDTIVVTDPGHLIIGDRGTPIRSSAPAEVVFSDVSGVADDLSLGLLAFGRITVHGVPKTPFHRSIELPPEGASSLTLSEAPLGWEVGDRLLVPATMPAEFGGVDEVVTITALDRRTVSFTPPLEEQRMSPRSDLTPHIANLSRSVQFRSAQTSQMQRGHIQLLHRRDFDIRYAALIDLARSNKVARLEGDNPPNRYPLYVLHNEPGSSFEDPGRIVGNVIERSIGQGFVVNDSHVALDFNVTYDVVGGGFVVEGGNETGAMRFNLAVNAKGRSFDTHPKSAQGNYEIAAGGVGFWSNSRLIYNFGNVAANTQGFGFVYFHRGTSVSNDRVRLKSLDHPDAIHGFDYGRGNGANQDIAAIQGFHDNEAYGTDLGVTVIKNSPTQQHDDRSVLERFVGWNLQTGAAWDYTGHYLMRDFELYAHPQSQERNWKSKGIAMMQNIVDMTFENVTTVGFFHGFHVHHNGAAAKLKFNSVPNNIQAFALEVIDAEVDVERNAHAESHLVLDAVSPDFVEPRLRFLPESDFLIGDEDGPLNIDIRATRVDSLGEDPFFFGTAQDIERTQLRSWYDFWAPGIIAANGVFDADDGTTVTLFPVLITDRLTGARRRYEVPVTLARASFHDDGPAMGTLAVYDVDGVRMTNSAPYAEIDRRVLAAGTDAVIAVLSNDSDVDGDAFTLDSFTLARHGTVTRSGDLLVYEPETDFDGIDSFTYTISDAGSGRSHTGVVRVDVLPLATVLPPVPETPTGSNPEGSDDPAADEGTGGELGVPPAVAGDDASPEVSLDSRSTGCTALPPSLPLLVLCVLCVLRLRRKHRR